MFNMRILIKYIVFFMLTFNIINAKASNVELELEDDNKPQFISADFKGALNLPHPIMLHLMLDDKTSNTLGRLIAIAYYFEVKYKGEALNYDFSDDVAYIFPDLSPNEIDSKTSQIRMIIKTYRWGLTKYKQIAAELIAPKPTPIIIGDDDYAIKGSIDYIPVPEDSYAVINEFKKVVSYSQDPKDLEAMELYRQRQLDKKKNKTDFDKFRSMVNKIEFSKIHRYGVDLPNPFIGNAGIGKWVEDNEFKARAISEIAQINDAKEFIVAIHINSPAHRFILANNLSTDLQKPKIELVEQENIASYEVLYPLASQFVDEMMIAGYTDNFAIPVKITTTDSKKGISFVAKTTFQSCDDRIKCITKEFITPLTIEQGVDNASSSMKNFIKQSYYNIPNDKSDNIHISEATANVSKDGKSIEKINFVIDISGNPQNANFIIEDERNTQFKAPQINIHDDKVYVSVVPLTNQDKLFDADVTVGFRLNKFDTLKQTVKIKPYTIEDIQQINMLSLFILAIFVGFMFNLSPLGLNVLCLNVYYSFYSKSLQTPKYWQKICTILPVSILLVYTIKVYFNIELLWGMQYNRIIYFAFCIAAILFLIMSVKHHKLLIFQNHKTMLLLTISVITILLPVSCTYNLIKISHQILYSNDIFINYITTLCMTMGILIPYILIACTYNKIKNFLLNKKLNEYLYYIIYTVGNCYIVYLILVLLAQITFISILKVLLCLTALFLLYKYFYAFNDALHKTKLSIEQKIRSEKVACIIVLILCLLLVNKTDTYALLKHQLSPILITQEELNKNLMNGKKVILSITSDWSLINALNNISAFNNYHLNKLVTRHNVEYINITASEITPEIRDYILRYNKYNLPVYILYTLNMNNGIILPDILTNLTVEETVRNFKY